MKQGKIKLLTYTGQEFGDKLKYNVSTFEGDNGIIWISKNPEWQIKEGDVIEYNHKTDNTTYKDLPKFDNWKKLKKVKKPMHGNYKPNNNFGKESEEYISPTEFKDNNIFFQSARRDFVLMNQGRNLSLQEIHDGALELYKKHKQIKNQL